MDTLSDQRLDKIFQFLEANHEHSLNFQFREWEKMIGGLSRSQERLRVLLYRMANTQSKPNLDALSSFWQRLHKEYNWEDSPSISSFCAFLGKAEPSLENLYEGLRQQPGWGPKTSALFVKNVVNIHRSKSRRLHFFSDGVAFAKRLGKGERLYLPVDTVIRRVYYRGAKPPSNSFGKINARLYEQPGHTPERILIWDDLWFWGFLTQRPYGKGRTMEWNEAKFWAMHSHAKEDEAKIRRLAQKFVLLVA